MRKLIYCITLFLLCSKTFAQAITLLGTASNTCTNDYNGSATFSLGINTYPYSAVVAGICNTVNVSAINSSTFTVNNLGTCIFNSQQIGPYNQYTLTLKDNANAIVGSLTFTIGSTYPYFLLQPGYYNNITCNNANNGSTSFAPIYGTGPFSYLWASSTNSAYATTNYINNASPGWYTLTATDAYGCKMVSGVSFYNPTPVVLSYSINAPGQPGCCNGNITFSASGGTPGGASSYTFSTVPAISSYTAVCQGTYTLTAADKNDCKDWSTVIISCVTGIAENGTENSRLTLYPNPNNGQFQLQLSEYEELPASISIKNILGQVVLNMDVTSNNTKVDLNDSPKGIYMALINFKEYTITKKIIKE
ncbi:MAG: T9SS type A sorting domain-containing protein [Bacteroidetes bacterium]|nr:T9SS type A sorting domain-containing protein [Bacteroidota bacterium]